MTRLQIATLVVLYCACGLLVLGAMLAIHADQPFISLAMLLGFILVMSIIGDLRKQRTRHYYYGHRRATR